MSLINQVLQDLDQRRLSDTGDDTRIDDLYVSGAGIKSRRKIYTTSSVIGLLIVVSVVSLAFWYNKPNNQQTINISTTSAEKSPPAVTTVAKTRQTQVVIPRVKKSSVTKTSTVKYPAIKSVVNAQTDMPSRATGKSKVIKQRVPMRKEQRAELAYQSGYNFLGQQDYKEGEAQLRRAIAIDTKHVKSRELLAGILIKQGRWVEVSEILRYGISVSPNHQPFVKLYARTLMQMNRDTRAIAVLRQFSPSIQRDPEHYALLAALYQRQNDHLSASNTYSEILKIRPNMGIWWVGMGISLEAMSNHKQAQQAYNRARSSGALHGDIARFTDNRLLALDEINFPLE